MSLPITPTKSNLLSTKKSLSLAKLGFDLLDRKRSILTRELMALINKASELQNKMIEIYEVAFEMLKKANISLGICNELASLVETEDNLNLSYRSVMGVEIPILTLNNSENSKKNKIPFGLINSNSYIDKTYNYFTQVKNLMIKLAQIEHSVYLLTNAIKKTQKRTNALKNIIIPRFETTIKVISEILDEKDREIFSKLKSIKEK